MVNEAFGWIWFVLGMGSGALLGLGFAREGFLGGYGSWERRILRLGHISFFGLGLINILFALAVARIDAPEAWISVASWALIVGGVTMPLTCALSAWRKPMRNLFPVPVLSLLLGASITAFGLTAPLLSNGSVS